MNDDIGARFQRLGQLHVGILLFPQVEVLDFAGPFEVFSVAARLGMLDGVPVTTHWEDIALLRRLHPHLQVRENVLGATHAMATARQMDHPYRADLDGARASRV